MGYSHKKLPRKTLRILRFVSENDGKVDPFLVANGCSDDENWARLKELEEMKFIITGQGYSENGDPCGPSLYMTNAGKAFLTDLKKRRG